MKMSKYIFILCVLNLFTGYSFAQTEAGDSAVDIEKYKTPAEEKVLEFLNDNVPEYFKIVYLESEEYDDKTLALDYSYDSSEKWKVEPEKNGSILDFGAKGFTFFAKGVYAEDKEKNAKNRSEIGGSYHKRWHTVEATSKHLTEDQNAQLQDCVMQGGFGEESRVDVCRKKLGFGETELSLIYFDADIHTKVEGDQDYKERHYVYGFEFNASARPHSDSWLHYINILEYPSLLVRGGKFYSQLPVITLGLEQLDPVEDTAREALLGNKAIYDRAYAQISHTSPIGTIKNQPVKLNYSFRYFKELDPEKVIKDAGLDSYNYFSFAVQLPVSFIPTLENSKSRIVISYSEGELPFNRSDDKVFELGWKSNFSDLF